MAIHLTFFFFIFQIFLGILVFIPNSSSASVPKSAGIVTQVAGQATLHRDGLTEALPVKFRDEVFLQDKIHTQERTFVRVLLGGKALVTVRELSVLTITEDLNHATIDIQSGIVGLSVARKRMHPGEYIEIRTPHVVAAVRGTTVLTQVAATTNMSVLEGFIDIAAITTPTQTIPLNQLNAIQAGKQGLGNTEQMSPEAIAQAHKQLQPDENVAPEDSPLHDSVANDQSDQAAALAEALAPTSDGQKADLQTKESQSGDGASDSDSIPQVLSTQDFPVDLVVPPNQTINTSRNFNTATLSGGTVDGSGTLTIDGTTTVTGGSNTVNNAYNSEGEVLVNAGSVNFKGGGTHEGGFSIAANTTLQFGGGTHNIEGDVTGPGTVEVSAGTVTVTGGTYDVTGNSTTVSGGTMTFNAGATLTSLGPVSIRNGGLLRLFTGATHAQDFSIDTGSTLEFGNANADHAINDLAFSGTGTVNLLEGTFNTTGTTTVTNLFNNQGTVNINEGSLALTGGGTHTGDFTTEAGTTLEFGGGTHDISGDVTGPGTVEVSAGTVTVTGGTYDVTGNSTTVSGGTLTFNNAAVLTSLGPLSLSSGLINLLSSEAVSIPSFQFSGGSLTGTDTITVTGPITVSGSGTKTINTPFNNEGPLTLQEGAIRLLGNGTHPGTFTTQASTTLEFGGGTHEITGDITGPGTVEVSAGTVNVNGGTYNVTGNSTSVSGGTMTFNAGATLTSLGPLTVSSGLLNLLSAEAVSIPSFTFAGGTVSGTDTVTVTGQTTVSGSDTKTVSAPFNNEGAVDVQEGTFQLLGNGSHTGSFSTDAGTTLEFSGDSHTVAESSFSGPGTVRVTGGDLTSPGKLFSLSEDLTTQSTLIEQTNGATTLGSSGTSGNDVLQIGSHTLDASSATTPLIDISGGELTTDGFSSDIIEVRNGTGSLSTGGSGVSISGQASVTLKGSNSSVLQGFGSTTSITTGDGAVAISGDAILDLDDQTTNDVVLVENGDTFTAAGSIFRVSDNADVRIGRSVGRVSGSHVQTTNGGDVIESSGGTVTMGDSILDLVGSSSHADVSGYVVSSTGGQINGPAGFNLVNIDAGELDTGDGVIHAEGDDRIILDSGTTNALVDIASADGTHDLGTNTGASVFILKGTDPQGGPLDTPLTKKDINNDDVAVDQTLLAATASTINTKQFLKIDQALLDASAPLLRMLDKGETSSVMTASPGDSSGFIDLANQADLRNNTNTMPLLTLNNSTLNLTTGHLLALSQSQLSLMGDFISLSNNSSLNINSANGFLVFATGSSALTINGALINFGGTGGNSVSVQNSVFSETINGIPFSFTDGATNAQVTVNGTPIRNPGLGTVNTPNNGSLIQVDGTQATVTIQGS